MSSTMFEVIQVLDPMDGVEENNHYFCDCNLNISLCGFEFDEVEMVDCDEDVDCIVCMDLYDKPCRLCGE